MIFPNNIWTHRKVFNWIILKTISQRKFYFQQWIVFREVRELFILVPALLGLKGNLDMCLASRLSTQANLGNLYLHWLGNSYYYNLANNLGNMTTRREVLSMVVGNIALVQVQAIVASFIVAVSTNRITR